MQDNSKQSSDLLPDFKQFGLKENSSGSSDEKETSNITHSKEQGTEMSEVLEITWFKDIIPYFLPIYIYLFSHLVYFFTGNLILSIWCMFILNPIINASLYKKEALEAAESPNIPKHLERRYIDDWRFLVPLYLYIIVDSLT
jgi:hypothetical protein